MKIDDKVTISRAYYDLLVRQSKAFEALIKYDVSEWEDFTNAMNSAGIYAEDDGVPRLTKIGWIS
jgi:hypothetical protein